MSKQPDSLETVIHSVFQRQGTAAPDDEKGFEMDVIAALASAGDVFRSGPLDRAETLTVSVEWLRRGSASDLRRDFFQVLSHFAEPNLVVAAQEMRGFTEYQVATGDGRHEHRVVVRVQMSPGSNSMSHA